MIQKSEYNEISNNTNLHPLVLHYVKVNTFFKKEREMTN